MTWDVIGRRIPKRTCRCEVTNQHARLTPKRISIRSGCQAARPPDCQEFKRLQQISRPRSRITSYLVLHEVPTFFMNIKYPTLFVPWPILVPIHGAVFSFAFDFGWLTRSSICHSRNSVADNFFLAYRLPRVTPTEHTVRPFPEQCADRTHPRTEP